MLTLVPLKNPSLQCIPGIYMLNHPFYTDTVKIGSSTNIGRRIKDSSYTTMFLEKDIPKLLDYFRVEGYETKDEVLYLERAIQRTLNARRITPNRELFVNVTPLDISNIIRSYGLTISQDRTPVNIQPDISNEIIVNSDNNLTPLTYQIPIINSLREYFTSPINKRGKLILPCGYGKMYIALFLLRNVVLQDKIAVVLLPSLILLDQFNEVAMAILQGWTIIQYNGNHKAITHSDQGKTLIVCTYQSAHELTHLIDIERVSYVIYDEAHRTCVTSKGVDEYSLFRDTINLFPLSNKLFMTATEKIVIYTEKVEIPKNEKDEEIINPINENVSDSESDIDGDFYYSMDNQQIYGETIYHKSFDQAVEERTISDYRLAVCSQDDNPIAVIRTGFAELGLHHLLTYSNTCDNARSLCAALQSCQYLRSLGVNAYYLDGQHTEVQRKEILRQFEQSRYGMLCSVKVLQEGISLPYVDGVYFVEPKSSEIDIVQMIGRALRLHRDKTLATILLPRTMLKYGQILKTLVMMDSRLKSDSGIKRRLIELPGIVTHGNNGGVVVGSTLFNVKLQILQRGEGLWEYKYNLCLEWEQLNPDKTIPRKLTFKDIKIGDWLVRQRHVYQIQFKGEKRYKCPPLTDIQIKLLNNLRTWNKYMKVFMNFGGDKWEMKFNACLQWEQLNPGKTISKKSSYQEINIGGWMANHKSLWSNQKDGKDTGRSIPLSLEQFNKLNLLFTWRQYLEPFDIDIDIDKGDPWENKFELCMEFELQWPNTTIPSKEEHKQIKIGEWLQTQRSKYLRQITGEAIRGYKPLSSDQIEKLSQLYSWNKWFSELDSGKRKGNWIGKYNACLAYETTYPDTIIHQKDICDGVNIGGWLSRVKVVYSKQLTGEKCVNRKLLSQEQVVLLEQLYSWREWLKSLQLIPLKNKDRLDWKKYLDTCIDFENQNSDTMIRNNEIHNDIKIGNWLSHAKATYSAQINGQKCDRTPLSEEQIILLNQLYTWREWLKSKHSTKNSSEPKRQASQLDWQSYIDASVDYENHHPNTIIRQKEIHNDIRIGAWLSRAKEAYSKQIKKEKSHRSPLTQDQTKLLNRLYTWRQWITSTYPAYSPQQGTSPNISQPIPLGLSFIIMK